MTTDPTVASPPRFPFAAVVGADDAKLALLLAAVDPSLGGVLLRGDKGSAKTTLVRGLAGVLGADVPFVDLPLGATEERVVGSLDLAAALGGGEVRFQRGLLATAHGGVLYVDEVNLLADHLVDVLLDAAATGVNRVERDGISRNHDARFLLVGSMNPEEGELRPQLLDRFGLAADVRNPAEPAVRAEIVRRRAAHDRDAAAFVAGWAEAGAALAARLVAARARLTPLPDDVLVTASELCVAAGADSLRADLALGRAAAAHAAWVGQEQATVEDLRAVAHLALAHRRHRHPLDHPADRGDRPGELDGAIDEVLGPPPAAASRPGEGSPPAEAGASAGPPSGGAGRDEGGPGGGPEGEGGAERQDGPDPTDGPEVPDGPGAAGRGGQSGRPEGSGAPDALQGSDGRAAEPPAEPAEVPRVLTLRAPRAAQPAGGGRRSPVETARGRTVGDRTPAPGGVVGSVAIVPTLRAAAGRAVDRAVDPAADGAVEGAGTASMTRPSVVIEAADLREPVREARTGNLLVLAVDASGSMEAEQRMDAVRAALLGLLVDAYQRRDRVALVTFGGRGAEVALRPTGSVEVARARLAELRTGGDTPLGDGIRVAADLAERSATPTLRPLLVVVTDGRATAGARPWPDACAAAEVVRRRGLTTVVIDVEAVDTTVAVGATTGGAGGRSGPGLGLGAELAGRMGARHVPLPAFSAGRLEATLRHVAGAEPPR